MASSYHLIVKKSLDENRIAYSLPEHIQRGWHRIYTLEEQQFNAQTYIIGLDVQIPNSVVRQRLGTRELSMKRNAVILSKAFELPDELFMNLSNGHKVPEIIEDEEKLRFEWNDDDNYHGAKHKKPKNTYQHDYDNREPLSLNDLIEEIHANGGKNLKNDDSKLIRNLMQIISRQKSNQIFNIYDELVNAQLMSKNIGVPKLVQVLQDIQKVFEQVAMKTNVTSIQTIINVLLENDKTYRLANDLRKSFNENMEQHRQQQILKFEDKSAASDLTMLTRDLKSILNIDGDTINHDRDKQIKFITEQLNITFQRAHLDGIKAVFDALKSSMGVSLNDSIARMENSLTTKLTEHESIFIESYIHDYLASLSNNELKLVYERLVQQGTLKRIAITGEMNQVITMSLMKKIDTNGLGAAVEDIENAQLDNNSINELTQALTNIYHYIQTQPSISLEQIENQLGMAYFIETHNLDKADIYKLSEAADLYSIVRVNLSAEATNDECSAFLENLKTPLIRRCIQRILTLINQDKTIDLDKVSSKFYNERIIDLLNDLFHGSDELNRNLVFHQIKKELKKNKELPDKLYRQMLKEKLIPIDTRTKIDTDKKKVSIIIHETNQIFNNIDDRLKQEQLVDFFDRLDITLPERVKHWYKTKENDQKLQSSVSKKLNRSLSTRHTMNKSIGKPTKTETSSKHTSKKNRSVLKFAPNITTKVLDSTQKTSKNTDKNEKEKLQSVSQTALPLKSEEQQEKPPVISQDQPVQISTTTNMAHVSRKPSQTLIASLPSAKEIIDPVDPLGLQNEIGNQRISDRQTLNTKIDFEEEFKSSQNISTSTEIFQADLEIIQPETTLSGNMNENKTMNFEFNPDVAPLVYFTPVKNDSKQEINIAVAEKVAESINDVEYIRIKARRLLAKTIPSNIVRQLIEEETPIARISSSSNLGTSNEETTFLVAENRKFSDPSAEPTNESPISTTALSLDNIKVSPKTLRRNLPKSTKKTADTYMNSLTKALRDLFARSEYDNTKLQKIHGELIASGQISPLNEFYRSPNEALRVTLDHCITYADLIKWTLSLLQTNNKPNLLDFGRDLYLIAIDLDFSLIERIDDKRCAIEIQENLKHELQTITETDLREINSYLNASQLEKLVHIAKKLNVTSKDRMISDLNLLLLHLVQICHTFELKYRPMQTRIREVGERFKSRAITDLVHKLDEIEKRLAKNFSITLFGLSKRMNESRVLLIK
ncbi:unnamed protein product [Rotaria magnacalcarata]